MIKELGITYDDVMYRIAWGKLLRMMIDTPRQVYISKSKEAKATDSKKADENVVVTNENSDELLKFIDNLNNKKRNPKKGS